MSQQRMIKVECYLATVNMAVPTDEAEQRALINEFNRLAPQVGIINRATYDEFIDRDYAEDLDIEGDGFMADDFAEWMITVWEYTNFVLNHMGDNPAVRKLSGLFGQFLIDTDGEFGLMGPQDFSFEEPTE